MQRGERGEQSGDGIHSQRMHHVHDQVVGKTDEAETHNHHWDHKELVHQRVPWTAAHQCES